ncbi:MAG: VOC family protein [Terriglobales bacterium]
MPPIERPVPGWFCWIELNTTDQAAAKRFYTGLLGWETRDTPIAPGEVYTIFELQGGQAGAAFSMNQEMRAQTVPPFWGLYVAVASADAAARRAQELGGTVVAPAFDVMDRGRMAVLRDPTGAVFSVWEANRQTGLSASGDGTFCWADCSTPDPAKASAFYSGLFGWTLTTSARDSSGYLHIKNGEQFIGGIPPAAYRQPGEPPHWLIWFAVANCDDRVKAALTAGAKTLMPPTTMERVGRLAVLADPQGAAFGLITPAPGVM